MAIGDKRLQILRVSFSLFANRGFDGTPTSLIAKEAEVSTGTLFHYFSSKEDLINALYLHCKAAIREALSFGRSTTTSLRDQIKELCLAYVRWGLDHPAEFRFLQQFRNSPYLESDTQKEEEARFESMVEVFREAIQSHELKQVGLDLLLALVNALLDAAVQYYSRSSDQFGDPQVADRFFSLVWDSIS